MSVYQSTGDMRRAIYDQDQKNGQIVVEADIIDNVTSTSTDKVLSANQGKLLNDKIIVLEDSIYEYEIYENISSGTTGTVTKPIGSTIRLDQYPNAEDCLITKVGTDERPIDEYVRTSAGVIVTATFDINGNYVLSGIPDAYPVALIYQVSIKGKDTGNIPINNIVDWTNISNARQVGYSNTISGLTAINVQDAIDEVEFNRTLLSSGVVTLPTYTDNGDGTITINSVGLANFYTDADDGRIVQVSTPTSTALTLADNATNFVYVDYNAGSPIWAVTQTSMDFLNDGRKVVVYRAYRSGTELHVIDYDRYGTGLSSKLFYKDIVYNSYQRQTGLTLSTTGTRISKVTAGTAWFGVQLFTLAENEAGVSGEIFEYYLTSGVWSETLVTEYDSTYYSDGTDRQTLSNNKYVAKYFFRGVELDNHVYYIHGNQYNSVSEAAEEILPSVPPDIASHSVYVGKIVIQKGATTGIAYVRDWSGSVASSGATYHNNLAAIDGGTAGEYYHLTAAQHTIATQAASATVSGYVTTGTQTFAGDKTFNNDIVANATTRITGAGIELNEYGTGSRAAYVDFHCADLPLDNTARIIQNGTDANTPMRYQSTLSGYHVFEGTAGGVLKVGFGVLAPTENIDVATGIKAGSYVITPVIKPSADSTTAFKLTKADGTTIGLNWDSTNRRVGINTANAGADMTVYSRLDVTANDSANQSVIALDHSGGVSRIRSTINGTGTLQPLGLYIGSTNCINIATTGDVSISKNLILPNTTFANQNGAIYKSGSRFLHDFNYGNNGTVVTEGKNVFVGAGAGNFSMGSTATSTSQSSYNTGVGSETMYSMTTGDANVATGYQSLYSGTTARRNVANGFQALYATTTGRSNVSDGFQTLFTNTTGNFNVAIGHGAGSYTSTASPNANGSGNILIGYSTKVLADNDQNEIVIGYNAVGSGSNSTTLGSSTTTRANIFGETTINGDKTPAEAIDVIGNIMFGNTDSNARQATLDYYSLASSYTPTDFANNLGTSGARDVGLYTTGLADATSSTSGYIWQYDGGNFNILQDGIGSVAIGGNTPHAKLDVDGGIKFADDTDSASADKVGTIRYRTSGNNSYVDICMQTGAATYGWINISTQSW